MIIWRRGVRFAFGLRFRGGSLLGRCIVIITIVDYLPATCPMINFKSKWRVSEMGIVRLLRAVDGSFIMNENRSARPLSSHNVNGNWNFLIVGMSFRHQSLLPSSRAWLHHWSLELACRQKSFWCRTAWWLTPIRVGFQGTKSEVKGDWWMKQKLEVSPVARPASWRAGKTDD